MVDAIKGKVIIPGKFGRVSYQTIYEATEINDLCDLFNTDKVPANSIQKISYDKMNNFFFSIVDANNRLPNK